MDSSGGLQKFGLYCAALMGFEDFFTLSAQQKESVKEVHSG